MRKCYDWDSNLLEVETVAGLRFYIQMRGYKTIVGGYSATGKSFLCSTIMSYKKAEINYDEDSYDTSDIILLNQENKSIIDTVQHKLIIIDRADLFITDKDVVKMNKDIKTNRYLIFARKPMPLYITPNYYGEFVVNDKIITLRYLFNTKDWM